MSDLAEVVMTRRIRAQPKRLAAIQDYTTFPTEILCGIFLLATDGECFSSYRIAQVCARWRDIALNYPRLWHHYVFNRPKQDLQYARNLLERSRNKPISISCCYLSSSSPPDPALTMLITSHFTHTYVLTLLGAFEPFIHTPAPVLRLCYMRTYHTKTVVITSPLFAGTAPCLTQLMMDTCRLPWAHGHYKNLTRLEINCGINNATHAVDSDVMHIFRDSPNLQEVEIKDENLERWLPGLRDPSPTGYELIPLYKLRLMVLEVRPAHFTYILARIATPPDLKLRWHASEDPCVNMRHPLFPHDPECLPLISRLRLFEIKMDRVQLVIKVSVMGGSIVPTHHRQALQPNDEVLNLVFYVMMLDINNFMCSLKDYFCQCLSTVRELRISYLILAHLSMDGMIALFRTFPSVEYLSLELSNPSMRGESRVWAPLMAECEKPGVGLFPNLQHLVIRETAIHEIAVYFLCMWLPRLHGLRTVHLDKCSFADEDVWIRLRDNLQQHADEVLVSFPSYDLDLLY